MAQQPRAVAWWCLAQQRCLLGAARPPSQVFLPWYQENTGPARYLAVADGSWAWHKAPQTAQPLWGWGWGCASLQMIQPWLHGVAALTEQPPACSRSYVFFSYAEVSCTPTSTITLTYLPRKKSITEEACFASNSCCHRRLLKNKNVLWNAMWVLPAPQCKVGQGSPAPPLERALDTVTVAVSCVTQAWSCHVSILCTQRGQGQWRVYLSFRTVHDR